MANVCSIEGCEHKAWSRGWCQRHYKRWYKHGDPHTVFQRQPKTSAPCEFPQCDRNSMAHGLCGIHYHRARHAGIERTADALREHDIKLANAILAPYGLSVAQDG